MEYLISRWRALWNPDMYHGWGKTKNYFEGWYFKIIDPLERYVFAVIPGISMESSGESHAFIQVLDGKKCTSDYYEFEGKDFEPSPRDFSLRLGNNVFSARELELDLPGIQGSLRIIDPVSWPRHLAAPGIMGWYSFVPFMECYHGVVSVHHTFEGRLRLNDLEVDFSGGKGYAEKDWGRSFPSAWIWMQTNHFDGPDPVSLVVSVANIPWRGSFFIGHIVGFLFQGKVYRFATYLGAKMKVQVSEESVHVAFKTKKNLLEVTARKGTTGKLMSPILGDMTGKINESMQAAVSVKFYRNNKLVFEGTGRNAGLEVIGDIPKLLTEEWKR